MMMSGIPISQRLYNISDVRIKYRTVFMGFLGTALCDTVPDEKTIREYREHSVGAKVMDTFFTGLTGKRRKRT
ncbi:MAG: transposase [Spirochaetaceae bacterium]|nr:transposase [Spirochaetaceae bacterium]